MAIDTTWVAIGAVGGGLGGVAAALGLIAKPVFDVRRQGREQAARQDQFEGDWYGEKARPGVPARPGVMERLQGIEKELHPNGGSTLRDRINETHAATGELRAAFDAHLRTHPTSAVPSLRLDLTPQPGPAQPLEP